MIEAIPIVDLFAGAGGMGEGFASFSGGDGSPLFRICLSIEKDKSAYQTLLLRTFYRQFPKESVPEAYYEYLRKSIDRETLFKLHPDEAKKAFKEAWNTELGKEPHENVRKRIRVSLSTQRDNAWVLIGGPPCQVYSTMGRARMRRKREINLEEYEKDERHYLYREYLRTIADHTPPVFIFENVKGLLSSKLSGKKIFHQILRDLQMPRRAVATYDSIIRRTKGPHYNIYSLVRGKSLLTGIDPSDYIIEAERFGVPQARHRVFLLGIREDLDIRPSTLVPGPTVRIKDIIGNLPIIRSGITKKKDSTSAWVTILQSVSRRGWFKDLLNTDKQLSAEILSVVEQASEMRLSTGAEFISTSIGDGFYADWYKDWFPDSRLRGVCNHSARSHMKTDLYRYLFASCFAKVYGISPALRDYPKQLLPNHQNVKDAVKGAFFSDRFKVQRFDRPASTVTSHISSDGHYYIHPDPSQCRSLTVREAARLQTFPDNYLFEGTRTEQFRQVGNAVPPYLAKQIAEIVYEIFLRIGMI